MPTRRLYAYARFTGENYGPLLTLHPDGSLTAESDDMKEAVPVLQARGLSNEFIFRYIKNRNYTYVAYIERVED